MKNFKFIKAFASARELFKLKTMRVHFAELPAFALSRTTKQTVLLQSALYRLLKRAGLLGSSYWFPRK